MNKTIPFLLACAVALIFWSCEKEKSGLIDPRLDTPFLLSAVADPARFNLDSINSNINPLPRNQYSVKCSLSALASTKYDPKALKRISYTLCLPNSDESIQSGSMENLQQDLSFPDSTYWTRIQGVISFRVDYYNAGIYNLNLTAIDAANAKSNSITLPILITRRNIKPQISHLSIPDTVKIPRIGFNPYIFTVTASDSDGYGDIYKVFFYSISPALSEPVEMYDDGDSQANGDLVPGDGIFSRILKTEPNNTPGTVVFSFHALDRAGALSDSLTKSVIKVR